MAYIEALLEKHSKDVDKLVNITQERLTRRTSLTDSYFPLVTGYDDFELLWMKLNKTLPIASIVGIDGDIPAMKNTTQLSRFTAEFFKMGVKKVWTEADQRKMIQYNNRIDGVPQSWFDAIFGTVEQLTMSVVDLMNYLTWQVITTGQCNFTDPRTKVLAELIYQVEASLFPADLTATGNPVSTLNRWSDSAGANGLQNLVDLNEAFYAINGYFPGLTVMSRTAYNQLRTQESTKDAAISAQLGTVASTENYTISPDILADLFRARELPPFFVNEETNAVGFDDEVEIEIFNDEGDRQVERARLLPVNKVTFLTRKRAMNMDDGNDAGSMGERAIGPSVEGNGNSGIFSYTEEVTKARDESVAVANGVPAVWDSRVLCAQTID